ncbi:MAG: hypothetical protein IJZ49_00415 [Alistipes sp.]|nr:hypothetical protein [Alistipes sp.]
MKKIITSILAASALFACQQPNEDIVPNNPDLVTFNIEASAPEVRTALVEENGKYGAVWTAGDTYSIIEVGDGANKQNGTTTAITENSATLSASVTVAAKSYSKYEYFFAAPKASMNGACTYMAMTLPEEQAPLAMTTFDGKADFLIGKPVEIATQPAETDVLSFEIARLSAIGKVTVKGLTLAEGEKVTGVKIEFAQAVAGKITNVLTDDLRAGTYPPAFTYATYKKFVSVTLPEAQSGDFTYYMCCWPTTLAAESAYTVTVTTTATTVTKSATLPAELVFSAGDMTSLTINMANVTTEPEPEPEPETPVVMPTYVTVAGVKWAPGNLMYDKDVTVEGFAAGWSIAASQAEYFHNDTTGDIKDLTDYNQTNLFNFGGITDPFSCAAESAVSLAASDPAFDFSGKMYTDQTCTTATPDFTAANYGDVAYWASNGKWRTPSKADFEELWTKASRTKATYNLGDKTINGTYFFDPAAGESPVVGDTVKELTNEDITTGLFLPWTGRGYDGTEYNVYKIGAQGCYRTATVNSTSALDATNGVIYRIQSLSEGAYYHQSYGATARYAIRPVYVE